MINIYLVLALSALALTRASFRRGNLPPDATTLDAVRTLTFRQVRLCARQSTATKFSQNSHAVRTLQNAFTTARRRCAGEADSAAAQVGVATQAQPARQCGRTAADVRWRVSARNNAVGGAMREQRL